MDPLSRATASLAPSGENARSRTRSSGLGVFRRVELSAGGQEGDRCSQRLIRFEGRVEPVRFDRQKRGLARLIWTIGQYFAGSGRQGIARGFSAVPVGSRRFGVAPSAQREEWRETRPRQANGFAAGTGYLRYRARPSTDGAGWKRVGEPLRGSAARAYRRRAPRAHRRSR